MREPSVANGRKRHPWVMPRVQRSSSPPDRAFRHRAVRPSPGALAQVDAEDLGGARWRAIRALIWPIGPRPSTSRRDRSGADQIDVEHQATDLWRLRGSNLSRRVPRPGQRPTTCSCSCQVCRCGGWACRGGLRRACEPYQHARRLGWLTRGAGCWRQHCLPPALRSGPHGRLGVGCSGGG